MNGTKWEKRELPAKEPGHVDYEFHLAGDPQSPVALVRVLDTPEGRAAAQMMVAAPALYAAGNRFLVGDDHADIEEVEAAIHQAEGRE